MVMTLIDTYSLCFLSALWSYTVIKDLNSTVAKRGSVFIGLMAPNDAIRSRY